MRYLHIEDLFVVGIGFDLAGGYLVARGLLASPRLLTQLAGSYYDSNVYLAVNVAQNRLDAQSGLAALGIGFTLQALGYVFTLGEAPAFTADWRSAGVAIGLLVAALVAGVVGGRLNRKLKLRRILVQMARYQGDGLRLELPRADMLLGWARALNLRPDTGEDELSFLRRTFGIRDALVREVGGYRRLSEGDTGELIPDG